METFKKKIEDRYKEKVKQVKDFQKEKQILEDFVKNVLPSNKLSFDKEGKLLLTDLDSLLKIHSETHSQTKT
jgi:hypothetical protein